jgi:hypothetical protein
MRLAAGGAPVALKRRAVEPVNKAKILPVYNSYQPPHQKSLTLMITAEFAKTLKYLKHSTQRIYESGSRTLHSSRENPKTRINYS